MSKQNKRSNAKPREAGRAPKAGAGMMYKDRDLCSVSPLKEQFEPTEALPIRQHNKMAGGG